MRWALLWLLASCGGSSTEPEVRGAAEPVRSESEGSEEGSVASRQPTSRGLVLYVEADGLVVQHDDTLGRLNPGVEYYPAPPELLTTLSAGQQADLWLEPMEAGGRRVAQLRVTGEPGLAAHHEAQGYPMTGTVIRVDGPEMTVDHEAIEGVMEAMVMPFRVGSRALAFSPGDALTARLLPSPYGWAVAGLRKVGTGDLALRTDVEAIQIGEALPRTTFLAEDGTEQLVGEGQGVPTLLTFIYTRCPDPTFCPALVSRLLALQAQLDPPARLVTLTLDPDYDTPEVLAAYGEGVGAEPERWRLGRMDPKALNHLALQAGLAVTEREGRIAHLIRVMILDSDGRLVERYDDNRWPLQRVIQQLNEGAPVAKQTGTLSP